MATNISYKKPNHKNIRSHALNTTKKQQKVNLQVVRDENGNKYRISAREKRTLLKGESTNEKETLLDNDKAAA